MSDRPVGSTDRKESSSRGRYYRVLLGIAGPEGRKAEMETHCELVNLSSGWRGGRRTFG